jgi:hypothetical protein
MLKLSLFFIAVVALDGLPGFPRSAGTRVRSTAFSMPVFDPLGLSFAASILLKSSKYVHRGTVVRRLQLDRG